MRNAIPRRGLHNMRTRTTRKATTSLKSPELYLKLTSLEMERSRRAHELENLLDRMRTLQERLDAIANEQHELRRRIDGTQEESILATPSHFKQNANNIGFTY